VRQAVLHIGTPKTATTSLQNFLRSNSKTLRDAGWYVPTRWSTNHSELVSLAYCEDRWDEVCAFQARSRGYGTGRLEQHRWHRVRKEILDELREIVVASSGCTVLFSGEGLYSRLTSNEIANLRATLLDAGVDAQVLVYLRDPLSARLSQLGQFVKAGWHLDLHQSLIPSNKPRKMPEAGWAGAPHVQDMPYELYSQRLDTWEKFFPGRVQVRLFDSEILVGGGIEDDFCHAVGIDSVSNLAKTYRDNVGLPWTIIKVLNEVNRQVNRRALKADGSHNTNRWLPPHELNQFALSAQKSLPGQVLVDHFQSYFSGSNEEIRRRYFPDREFLWRPLESPGVSNTNLSVDLTSDEWLMVDFLVQVAKSGMSHRVDGNGLSLRWAPSLMKNWVFRFAIRHVRGRHNSVHRT